MENDAPRYSIQEDTDTEDFRYDPDERFFAMAHIGEDGEPEASIIGGFPTRQACADAVREAGGIVDE